MVVDRALSRIGITRYEDFAIGFIDAMKVIRLKDGMVQFAFARMQGWPHAGTAVRDGDRRI